MFVERGVEAGRVHAGERVEDQLARLGLPQALADEERDVLGRHRAGLAGSSTTSPIDEFTLQPVVVAGLERCRRRFTFRYHSNTVALVMIPCPPAAMAMSEVVLPAGDR